MRCGAWLVAAILAGCGSSATRDEPVPGSVRRATDAGVDLPSLDESDFETPPDAGESVVRFDGGARASRRDGGAAAPMDAGAGACDVFLSGQRDREDVAEALWLRQEDVDDLEYWFKLDFDLIAHGLERACDEGVEPKALTLAHLTKWWNGSVGLRGFGSGWCAEEEPHSLERAARTVGVREALASEFIETLGIDAEQFGRVTVATSSSSGDWVGVMFLYGLLWELEGSGGAVVLELAEFSSLAGVRVERAWDSEGSLDLHLSIRQPYDHDGPAEPSFEQSVEVSVVDPDAPTVLGTGGYGLPDYGEAYSLLHANRVGMAHRFHDRAPDEPELWRFLTPEQAAHDVHRVVRRLQPLLPGPWISTGFSKGGSTALLHRRYFPRDVVGTIASVAPLGFQENPDRGLELIENIDHDGCVERVHAVQRAILERFDELREGRGEEICFDQVSPAKLFYAATQYEWGFWTRRSDLECDDLPGADAPLDELSRELEASLWGQASVATGGDTRAWEYEMLATWGTPNLVREDLRDLVEDVGRTLGLEDEPAPWGDPPPFDPLPMQQARDWVATEGRNLLLSYGEYDPWSAWFVDLGDARRSLSVQIPEGLHWSGLGQATRADRDAIRATLERWVDPQYIETRLFELE